MFSLLNAADAALLFSASLAHHETEHVHAAYLSEKGTLLALDRLEGTYRESIALPIRQLIEHALQIAADRIIIAHNHPSGDPTPSRQDIAATRKLVRAAHTMDIRVLDHLIFTRTHCTSFRGLGLL